MDGTVSRPFQVQLNRKAAYQITSPTRNETKGGQCIAGSHLPMVNSRAALQAALPHVRFVCFVCFVVHKVLFSVKLQVIQTTEVSPTDRRSMTSSDLPHDRGCVPATNTFPSNTFTARFARGVPTEVRPNLTAWCGRLSRGGFFTKPADAIRLQFLVSTWPLMPLRREHDVLVFQAWIVNRNLR